MNWMIYLKTTETCNLNCKHCFTNGINGKKIFFDQQKTTEWLNKLVEYKLADTFHIEFHGGEPFLVSPEVIEKTILSVKNAKNITWGATSNLVLKLTDKHFDLIEGPFGGRVGTSWDRTIRFANKKQIAIWHKNVKQLISRGNTVKLFVSVTRDTLDIEPIVLLRWIRRLGIQEVSFERLTENGNALKYPEIFPSNLEQDAWFLKMHQQSEKYGARHWFTNEFLENVYAKFETGFLKGGTFCRDCEEKILTINADGSISGCPNSAQELSFGHIKDDPMVAIQHPVRINNIACERSRDPRCYTCEVFHMCGGDCHQLSWQDGVCGAPKSLIKHLSHDKYNRKIWEIKNGNIN